MFDQFKHGVFEYAGRRAACDLRDTIIVAGAPRSGTTWLLELFRTLPGYKALNEPLMYPEARHQNGFDWRTYIAPGECRPQESVYLRKVLAGQLGISPAWFFEADTRPFQLAEHAMRRKLVVKFCRVGRMLQWLIRQFDVRGTVFIVRHPCAVVASMLRHGAWKEERLHGGSRLQQALHDQSIPDVLHERFGPTLERIDSQVEALAVMWCLDHYVPFHLHSEAGYPWVLVPYERLVSDGIRELKRVNTAIGVKTTPGMRAQFDEPSVSVRDRPREKVSQQLSKWKRRLNSRQVDDILCIVEDFGLNFYTDELHPNFDRLMQFQRDESEMDSVSYAT